MLNLRPIYEADGIQVFRQVWPTVNAEQFKGFVDASAYRHPVARQRFLIRRGTMLSLVGPRMGIPAADVELRYGEFGKPYVEGGIEFNVSSSRDFCLYALGPSVGVDVEAIETSWGHRKLAVFTRNEAAWVGEDERRFYEIWTRKEAVIKALGVGLSLDLKTLDVLNSPIEVMGRSVKIVDLDVGPGYVAAVAY